MQNGNEMMQMLRTSINDPIFSILIPTWNNLAYLKLCINSIRKHTVCSYQLIVHINDGNDGTREWIQEQDDIDYTCSTTNIGVCYALNASARLARAEYLVYINDDMYVCPGWDQYLLDEIRAIGHNRFFLSATAIEPVAQSACSINKDYGRDNEHFNEALLLSEYHQLPFHDWLGATWPPNVVHKYFWKLVGGYSTEFSPGMYSDPDFSMKLWQAGIRYFKGVSKSRVYHFTSVSVKRVKKNRGYYTFIAKWGITSSTFTKKFLRRGKTYDGILTEPTISTALRLKNLFKRLYVAFIRF